MSKVDLDDAREMAALYRGARTHETRRAAEMILALTDELAQLRAEIKTPKQLIDKGGDSVLESLRLAEDCVACLEHAVELGYFAEGGSTEKWAKSALAAYRAKVGGEGK